MPYTLDSGIILPSVTEILNATATPRQRQLLADWEKENPGAGNEARARGNYVHAIAASYLLQEFPRKFPTIDTFPDSIQSYVKSLVPFLIECGPVRWVETEVGGGNHQFVWSELGYAGRPDWLVNIRQELVLVDLKTATKPYHPKYRGDGPAYAKFCKATTQLAAYTIAIEECLGVVPDRKLVLVALPDRYQTLEMSTEESTRAHRRWLKRLEKYQQYRGRAAP